MSLFAVEKCGWTEFWAGEDAGTVEEAAVAVDWPRPIIHAVRPLSEAEAEGVIEIDNEATITLFEAAQVLVETEGTPCFVGFSEFDGME